MTANRRPHILVIMGSVRANRRCPHIAGWVAAIAQDLGQLACELVDLKDWNLSPAAESEIPATGRYSDENTRRWSAKVASANGFVIVSPQYNWGYPAPLKNALDHLYKEWAGKPLVVVTYGGRGGDKCAAQLLQVADALKLQPMKTTPAITVARELIESGLLQDPSDLAPFVPCVTQALEELTSAFVETNSADAESAGAT